MSRFLHALHSGRVLLMDGAMGTELLRAGLQTGECGEYWNFQHPERVHAIQEAYAQAGARVLLTNTFQAIHASIAWQTRPPAPAMRWQERKALLVLQWTATVLGRAAAGPQAFVLADLGSYFDNTTGEEFSDFGLLIDAARTLGPVDGVLLETCSTRRVARAIPRVQKACPDYPVLLSMTFLRDNDGELRTIDGAAPEWFAERARDWGLAGLGVNCGRDLDMDAIVDVVRRYRVVADVPLFARPNAGTPKPVKKRWVYPLTPKAMARKLPALLEAGVAMVGGCCGTTPAHIAAMRPIIDGWNKS